VKISNGQVEKVLEAYLNRVNKSTKRDEPAPISAPRDQVTLSARASKIEAARALYSQLPEVREDKVAEITRQMEQGRYQPSSGEIADAILQQARLARLGKRL
jgi:flagellar biosynthesis anti-sigma factor FlgM